MSTNSVKPPIKAFLVMGAVGNRDYAVGHAFRNPVAVKNKMSCFYVVPLEENEVSTSNTK